MDIGRAIPVPVSPRRIVPSRRLAGVAERVVRLPLRWQIGGLVILGLVAIFSLFGLLGGAIAKDGKDRTLDQWLSIARSSAGFIDSEIELQYGRLERAASLVAASSSLERQRDVLEDVLGRPESFVGSAFRLDRQGITWASADRAALERYLAGDPGLLTTIDRRYASGVVAIGGQPAFILAVPILTAGGERSGVVGVVGRPDRGPLGELVASARGLAKTGHAELVDQHDMVISSSEREDIFGEGEHPDFYLPLLESRHSGLGLTAPVGDIDPTDRGQRHDMAFIPLLSVPWGLALGGSEAELAADANRWQQQIALLGGVVLALASLLVWLTTRGVTRPIRALTAASRQIAAGDFTAAIPHEGEGEVRELSQAFDDMRQELGRARGALAMEKSRYEGIVTSMADAVVTTDMELNVTAFNPSAALLLGRAAEDVVGRASCGVICSHDPGVDDCRATCMLGSVPPALAVSKDVLRRSDGREVSVAIARSGIHDQTGRLVGVVHVLRDISAEEEVARLKDEFLSTVSHELRTPLGFIMGYATTLLLPDAPKEPSAVRRCIEVIAEASGELKELVDNLLDMTRIGAGTLSVTPGAVRLAPLAHEAVERIRVRGHDEHRFVVSVPRSLPSVWADGRRVEQVLYNLLDNAIKYSPEGGEIAVEAVRDRDEIRVRVRDEGIGLDADEVPLLFSRFHRGRAARERGIGGTGLGLAICRGIVEANGGRIWVESPAGHGGRGTAVTFTLPLGPREVAA